MQGTQQLRISLRATRAISALNHPNTLTIHEISETDGRCFIATEFIEGQTLRGRLQSGLDIGEALDIAVQIASALARQNAVGGRIGEVLLEQGVVDERTVTEAVAEQSGLKVVDLRRYTPEPDAVEKLTADIARSLRVLPLRVTESGPRVYETDGTTGGTSTGSDPKRRSAPCWSVMPTPEVAMNGIMT